MTTHYFIVTPLNYLTAQEYQYKHPNGKHYLYIVSNYRPTNAQFAKIIREDHWDKIIWIKNTIKSTGNIGKLIDIFYKKFYLKKHIKNINSQDKIILGNFGNNWCKYIAQKSNKKIILVDDGFSSINYFHEFLNKKYYYNEKLLSKFEIYIYGLNRDFDYNLEFFSAFKYPKLKDSIKNHTFDFLKLNSTPTQYSNSFFFIGGPYIRLKIIEENQYKKIIETIFRNFEKRQIACYYIPHRTEEVSSYEWKIIDNKLPFEVYFNNLSTRPKYMGSFFSTAIFNSFLIDPHNIEYFFYNIKQAFSNENQTELYEYLKEINAFSIVEI